MSPYPDRHRRLRVVRNTLWWLSAIFGVIAMVFFGIGVWIGEPQATSAANMGGVFLSAAFVAGVVGLGCAFVLDTAT